MDLKLYVNFIKTSRAEYFSDIKPYDLIYKQFTTLDLNEKSPEYFYEHASIIMKLLRDISWNEFQEKEKHFTSEMLASLYENKDIDTMGSKEAINWFTSEFPSHIYSLNLSNTQSRRSRAGKEFEAIIELILMGANIPLDSQGSIGTRYFTEKGLGKLVDIVSPGSTEYTVNKRDTVLISAKTTLRERWQEVPEEMARTGAREMFLVTLDESISQDVIETLNDNNIQLVTTKSIKEIYYPNNHSVITLEKLLLILKETADKWDNFPFPQDKELERKLNIEKQIQKHLNHPFIVEYYKKLL
ncbi:type II restriction endonuclease [Veillonella sp. VA137]|uniref:type II restriction endonuclease n=1 Tax=Veillonella sp. VA137 TaxID=741828 RepID=UPI000F8F00BE|nr:type II restriction endonuclease [Veillonella sp. VA137]